MGNSGSVQGRVEGEKERGSYFAMWEKFLCPRRENRSMFGVARVGVGANFVRAQH